MWQSFTIHICTTTTRFCCSLYIPVHTCNNVCRCIYTIFFYFVSLYILLFHSINATTTLLGQKCQSPYYCAHTPIHRLALCDDEVAHSRARYNIYDRLLVAAMVREVLKVVLRSATPIYTSLPLLARSSTTLFRVKLAAHPPTQLLHTPDKC